MSRTDFSSHRLHVAPPLSAGAEVALTREQANYLVNVLRLAPGQGLLVFNGRDGEWRARLAGVSRKAAALEIGEQVRPQPPAGDLWYLFAPLKAARLDYMVQKAVEMGASRLVPVITRRTIASRVNLERMRANVIEAAEQCGILSVPEVVEDIPFERLMADWPDARSLVFCDEEAEIKDPVEALGGRRAGSPLAVIIGPEGGFAPEERKILLAHPACLRLSLGPRILRADTAAVAALALVQAVLGDGKG